MRIKFFIYLWCVCHLSTYSINLIRKSKQLLSSAKNWLQAQYISRLQLLYQFIFGTSEKKKNKKTHAKFHVSVLGQATDRKMYAKTDKKCTKVNVPLFKTIQLI